MARTVRINQGKGNVTLPNGRTYKAGDEVLLTDDEYAQLQQHVRTLVSDLGWTPDSSKVTVSSGTLTSITDPVTIQQVLDQVTVRSELDTLAQAGRSFIASTGRLTLSVAGNVRVTFENPVGSGRDVWITKFGGLFSSTSWVTIFRNPTDGLPSTVRPNVNSIFGQGGGVAVMKSDTSTTVPLGGGISTGWVIGSGANTRMDLDFERPMVLEPGVTLGMNVPFTGAAEAVLAIHWAEKDR